MAQDLHDKITDERPMPSSRSQRIARNTLFLFVRMAVVTLLSLYTVSYTHLTLPTN